MNSLLEDALGFVMDNFQKAGQSFKESNERDRALIQSYKSGGQVDPQQREGMLMEYVNQANPMTAMGGMIKPSTWAKYTPEAKAQMTGVANRYPQAFKERVLDTPQDIHVKMDKGMMPNVAGNFLPGHVISSSLDAPARIKLNPNLGGKTLQNERILEHELLHNVNEQSKRITDTDPDDAWTIARLLQSKLPSTARGSLDNVIHKATDRPPDMGLAAEFLAPNMDYRTMRKMGPITHQLDSWHAMDEALAHLSEAAARPGASPEIRKLAKELGVSWEDKTKEVLFGGPNSPKWNPRDVSMPPIQVKPTVNIPRKPIDPASLAVFNALKKRLGLE